jgi:hypothetical protein
MRGNPRQSLFSGHVPIVTYPQRLSAGVVSYERFRQFPRSCLQLFEQESERSKFKFSS